MNIKPIKTKSDYSRALTEIERLMGAEFGTPDGDKLDVLATLVEAWEDRHYPVGPPDPIEAIIHQMESQNLTCKNNPKRLKSMLGDHRSPLE